MAGCSVIQYKGKEILYFNYQGLTSQDHINMIHMANKMLMDYKGENIAVLSNFIDTFGTKDVMDALTSEESKEAMKKVNKTAGVGITGYKKILLNLYNTVIGGNTRLFDSEEDAKEWLIK